ncbi:hypothetical protein HOLleu_11940 [Holothuria leucospilota]|uniref:C2H2-type domain-containing protein n=1 Tax=Holothuria leucospilota TaxID=206669 RepID=A0A9Q1CA58_HOLLE|nr:hypothetical protein HOLleu_11940 [Holothuria leucospilota]
MSQDIFNVLAASMDTSGLSMQSLLDTQPTPVQESPGSQGTDEEDVFQCGKCKKQFSSLTNFMVHKREQCSQQQTLGSLSSLTPSISRSQTIVQTPQTNSAFTVTTQQGRSGCGVDNIPQSPLGPLNSGMILSDEVLISPFSSMDQNMQQGIQQLQTNIQQLQQSSLLPPSSLSGTSFLTSQNGTRLVTSVSNVALPGGTLQTPQQVFTGVTSNLNIGGNQLIHLNLQPALTPQTIQATSDATPVVTQQVRRIAPATDVSRLPTLAPAETSEASTSGVSSYTLPKKGRRSSDGSKKSGKLKCTYCGSSFTKNFDLQQHIRSHTGEKPFQCIVCGRAFAQKSNVKKHMQTHKVWPGGKEDTLPKTLIQKIGSTEDKDRESPAVVVEKGLGDVHLGADQKTYLYIDNSYVCKFCEEKFKSYFQLKSHMTVHKDLQVYKCVVQTCDEVFKDMDKFIEHTKTHDKELVYRCRTCNKQFSTLYDLGVHQYSHSLYPNQGPKAAVKDFKCSECNTKYASPEALEHHIKTSSHNYPCPECKKVFSCERFLRRHLISHAAVGQFTCEVCNKSFKTEYYLRSHILIHTGDNPFQCDVCQSAFNRKDKLKRHKLIHNAVKRYKCPFKSLTGCEKEFHRADKLKAHIISHSGIKPFKCDKCDRCFTRKPTLQEHMKLHTGDFQFHCGKCGKGFQRDKYLKGHRCGSNKGPKRLLQSGGDETRQSKETEDGPETNQSQEEGESVHRPKGYIRGKLSRKRKFLSDDGRQTRVVHTKTRQVLMKGPQLVKKTRKSRTKPKQLSTSDKFAFIDEDVHTIKKALEVEIRESTDESAKKSVPEKERRETVIIFSSSTEAENNIRQAMDDREALMENMLSESDK